MHVLATTVRRRQQQLGSSRVGRPTNHALSAPCPLSRLTTLLACPCRGVYLVAPGADDAEGWVDALLLLAHLARQGQLGGVKAALAVRR